MTVDPLDLPKEVEEEAAITDTATLGPDPHPKETNHATGEAQAQENRDREPPA